MMPAKLDLNLLIAFEALYREGSVTAAARRLGLGQPAMSAALARLRKMLGDTVFERVGQRMLPSPRAQDMAPSLFAALDAIRETVRRHSEFAPAATDRVFTIASTDYTSLVLVPGLVSRLRAEASGVQLRVIAYDKDELGAMLDANLVDAALGVFPAPPPSVVARTLYRETFVGIARSDHPAIRDDTMSLGSFAGLPHALVSVRRDTRGFIDDALAARGLSRTVALTLPHMMALPDILSRSDLIAAIPARVVPLLGPGVRAFRLPLATEPWSVGMMWNPNQRHDPGGRWLRSVLMDVARVS